MILFRCNAGPKIGFGHLTRCRALAYALREQGESCIMVGPDHVYTNKDDADLFYTWIPQKWRGAEKDALSLAMLANEYDANKLVLDDYRVNEEYQLVLRNKRLKWLQFEARTLHPIWADIVLNASPAAKPEEYAPVLRNSDTQLLLGPEYAVLRPEFFNIKPRNPKRTAKKVLVTFGGGDDRGAILFVLKTLLPATSEDLSFIVVSGENNPRNKEVRSWIRLYGQGRVVMKINPKSVAQIFANCDFAIMAGGTTTYEAAFCGLPMMIITIAENQILQAKAWHDLGAAVYIGVLDRNLIDDLCSNFLFLNSSLLDRKAMQAVSVRLVDGNGKYRVASELVALNY